MPRPAQNPVGSEAVNLRRRRSAREGTVAEYRADRRDGHDGVYAPVREIRQQADDRPVLPAVGAEVGVLVAVAGAVPDEQARVRPAADQGEHAVAAGRVADRPDPSRVDARAEFGIAEQPVQDRAELSRAPAPVGCGAAEPAVAPIVAGMIRRRHDVAGRGQPDRRTAMVQSATAGAVRDQDKAVAAGNEGRIPGRVHGEGAADRPSGRRTGRIPDGRRHPLAAGLDPDIAETDAIGIRMGR